jgi:hypothetical protein
MGSGPYPVGESARRGVAMYAGRRCATLYSTRRARDDFRYFRRAFIEDRTESARRSVDRRAADRSIDEIVYAHKLKFFIFPNKRNTIARH